MNEEKISKSKKSNRSITSANFCNKLPVDATKQQKKEAHLVKMSAKKIVANRMHEQDAGPSYIRANLSNEHPDSGMSPSEHTIEKRRRVLNQLVEHDEKLGLYKEI